MRLLIICGRKRSGKDTVADIICSKYETDKYTINRLALATCLKEIFTETFNLSIDKLDQMKNNNLIFVNNIKMRDCIINFGETIKNRINKNIWCEMVEKKLDNNKINIITDMRYEHEYMYFLKYNPIIIKIEREHTEIIENENEIEQLKYNYLIKNNSNLDSLKTTVNKILDTIII